MKFKPIYYVSLIVEYVDMGGGLHRCVKVLCSIFTVYFSEKITCAYNSVTFSLIFTKFGMEVTHVPVFKL